ncbi:MAG TPA: hypothetical protein VES42_02195, partial [Pilimelia sp.]|nr:hypothetical protein [Pilimelia sp.]
GPQGPAVTSQDLLLYDVRAKRTAVVAAGVGQVVSRAGWLWWSTGEEEQLRWQALDLRTLVD